MKVKVDYMLDYNLINSDIIYLNSIEEFDDYKRELINEYKNTKLDLIFKIVD